MVTLYCPQDNGISSQYLWIFYPTKIFPVLGTALILSMECNTSPATGIPGMWDGKATAFTPLTAWAVGVQSWLSFLFISSMPLADILFYVFSTITILLFISTGYGGGSSPYKSNLDDVAQKELLEAIQVEWHLVSKVFRRVCFNKWTCGPITRSSETQHSTFPQGQGSKAHPQGSIPQ